MFKIVIDDEPVGDFLSVKEAGGILERLGFVPDMIGRGGYLFSAPGRPVIRAYIEFIAGPTHTTQTWSGWLGRMGQWFRRQFSHGGYWFRKRFAH